MSMLDQTDSSPAPAVALHYAIPEAVKSRWGMTVAVVLIVLFVCMTSFCIFMAVVQSRREVFPAAVAVLGLSAMGICCSFFLTRK